MVYTFNFGADHTETITSFVQFAETLKTVKYIMIDWHANNGFGKGFVKVMCSRKDYEECFYWLSKRGTNVKVKREKE